MAAALALGAYGVRAWEIPSDPLRLKDEYLRWDETLTKYALFDTLLLAFQRNQVKVERKGRLLRRSHQVLAVGLGVLFLTFLYNLGRLYVLLQVTPGE